MNFDLMKSIFIIFVKLLDFSLNLLGILIFIRVIMSWINLESLGYIWRLVYNLTEPILNPLRLIIRLGPGGLDLSPLIAFLIIMIIRRYLVGYLFLLISRL